MELKQYIDPIQCYCALNEVSYPILNSISKHKKTCFAHTSNVVKVGLQLFIPIEYKSWNNQHKTPTILARNLYCVVHKLSGNVILESISQTAKLARQSVDMFTSLRYKVIKCEIILLTQQQHLN